MNQALKRVTLNPIRSEEPNFSTAVLPEFKRRIDTVTDNLWSSFRKSSSSEVEIAAEKLVMVVEEKSLIKKVVEQVENPWDKLGEALVEHKNRKPINTKHLIGILVFLASHIQVLGFSPIALILIATILFFERNNLSEELAKFKS